MAMTSIRHKFSVAVLLTTLVALVVSSLALTFYNLQLYKNHALDELSTQALLLGRASAEAIVQGDPGPAHQILGLLVEQPIIHAAAVYGPDGQLFARYHAEQGPAPDIPQHAQADSHRLHGGFITMFRQVFSNGQLVGTVYLQAHYQLYKQLLGHLAIALLVCVLAMAIAVLISLWLQRSVTSPILAIARLARQVVEKRDYSLRAVKTTSDEIGYLSDALNEMLAAVEQRNLALTESNKQLQTQIKEREIAEHSLRQSEQRVLQLNAVLEQRVEQRTLQLQNANQELEAFSYSVSHDLRTPLRAIDGFSQALLEDYSNQLDDVGRDYLQRVRRGAQRMGTLIDDLLKLARVSRCDIQLQQIDLSAIAVEILAELSEAEPTRKIKLQVAPDMYAFCDPHLIRIALQNLLDNAWKYSSRQSLAEIEFGCKKAGGTIEYFIKDNGAGFDMAYAGKLFGAFQRMHNVDEFPGTGVGLATVQRVIHRHGGRIWADSAVNKGTTLYFTLPEPEPEPEPEQTIAITGEYSGSQTDTVG